VKIIVCVKQTFDTEAKIVLEDGKVSDKGVKLITNPYDEFAVEEAIRLKEKEGGEVVLVCVGADSATEAMRYCLAMGGDRGIHLSDEAFLNGDEKSAAAALAKAIEAEGDYDLILCGQVAVDDGSAQVPQRVAELLDIPQVTIATKIEIEDGKAKVTREADGGSEIWEVELPAVITAQRGLNEPRYPSLPNIMKAKKKEIKNLSPDDIDADTEELGEEGAGTEIVDCFLPPKREAGKIFEGEVEECVAELVKALKEEAKVI
jgi:electron transfer flavoprotein beta subunit